MEQAISKDMCLHRKDEMKQKTLTEKRFFEWHEDDVAVTLRNKGGSYGNGSEVLIICYTKTKSGRCAQPITSGFNKSK